MNKTPVVMAEIQEEKQTNPQVERNLQTLLHVIP